MIRNRGRIIVRGIVQGVGFRPFVYAKAQELGLSGTVKNLGSEVEIRAAGERFEDFLDAILRGPPLARIDSVKVTDLHESPGEGFTILPSAAGALTGMIPPDVATCDACIADIFHEGGRYEGYYATSCTNCGPRYSIIEQLPFDRERTSMSVFPMCPACESEYHDPHCRRHHAQTIACPDCGPALTLYDSQGRRIDCCDPVRETASLINAGRIVGMRGIGGFHLACIEESADELKRRLGRIEQPFAVMVRPGALDTIAYVSDDDRNLLNSPVHPIIVLVKRDPSAHAATSNLHTIGCMLPYTGLHHLLFSYLTHPLLIMTSANMPGYPMITDIDHAMAKLAGNADFFLTHNRVIVNRCDDSVIRDGYIIRLSRGIAPRRKAIDLGNRCILGVGPELNANATVYCDGFAVTSPHVGNVRNPSTLDYLRETVARLRRLLGAHFDVVAHDLHPQFLSTRFAQELADETNIERIPVQHHRAHIAATTTEPCIGVAIDGVGYGDDGTVWGGEVFCGQVPDLERVAHLEPVPMPGGDLATRFPERMLYGILPEPEILTLLASRGWSDIETGVLKKQVDTGFNVAMTSSTGRVLDAASALLGTCRERTYDGEPAMKLESAAARGTPEEWDLIFSGSGREELLSSRALMESALARLQEVPAGDRRSVHDIAASFQFNLARGIARLAINAARKNDMKRVALSGGVAYNHMIRETIRHEISRASLDILISRDEPLGDGCVSFGQCVYAGMLRRQKD